MEEKENKKTTAMNALQKIRERVKPGRESAVADQLKEEYSCRRSGPGSGANVFFVRAGRKGAALFE